ncbi:MAG: carboxylate--amine ligase, partial [Adlercreutzia sp.]|nr:carboxylate--amine ligase [Adlercreutzia sp.]
EETVPMTAFLNDDEVNIAQIRANREEWIIKPTDHYGADNVYAGCEVSQEEWERVIDEFANERAGYPFIVQRYIRPFKTKTLPPDFGILDEPDGAVVTEPALYNNLNGLYLFNGHFGGVFSRLGPHPTISKPNGGITAATLWVDCDNPDARPL